MTDDELLEQIAKVIKAETDHLKHWLQRVEQKIEAVNLKLDKVQEDIAEIICTLIDGHTKLEKRVSRIEDHIGT